MKQKILIVEDDPFIALDLQEIFEGVGFSVLGPVAAVREACTLINNCDPDIAMLDYNLGRETSLPVARSLEKRGIPFLFLSGFVEKIPLGQKYSNSEVMIKPFGAERIVERVMRKLTTKPA